MIMRRTETIQFGEFMNKGYKNKAEVRKGKIKPIMKAVATTTILITVAKTAIPAIAITLPIALATRAIPTMATQAPAAVPVGVISDQVKGKIIHAFDPLVDLMVSLSLPIAGVMLTGGALLIMIGMKEKGYSLIMSGSIGYILVQLSPMFIGLLEGVGNAL